MTGWFSSYRRRRRIMWSSIAAALVGGAVTVGVLYPNTGSDNTVERFSSEPVKFVPPPKPVPLTREVRSATLRTAAAFVQTAVRRERLADSYDLVAPSLRGGLSRKEWLTGNIPIAYYPVDVARYRFDYSYPNLVGWQIAVWPRRGENLRPMVFLMDLVPQGSGEKRRWVVSNWTPALTDDAAPLASDDSSPLAVGDRLGSGGESRLGAAWLLVPMSFFGACVLALGAFVVRSRIRAARAERAYRAGAS